MNYAMCARNFVIQADGLVCLQTGRRDLNLVILHHNEPPKRDNSLSRPCFCPQISLEHSPVSSILLQRNRSVKQSEPCCVEPFSFVVSLPVAAFWGVGGMPIRWARTRRQTALGLGVVKSISKRTIGSIGFPTPWGCARTRPVALEAFVDQQLQTEQSSDLHTQWIHMMAFSTTDHLRRYA